MNSCLNVDSSKTLSSSTNRQQLFFLIRPHPPCPKTQPTDLSLYSANTKDHQFISEAMSRHRRSQNEPVVGPAFKELNASIVGTACAGLGVDTVCQGPGKMIASTGSKDELKTMEFRGTDLFCQEGDLLETLSCSPTHHHINHS